MSIDSGADWGVPYYNRVKPDRYMISQIRSKIADIDSKIMLLEKEKFELHKLLNGEK
jgi:hypothetical protein